MEATLERELLDIRQTLLDYRIAQPESNFLYCLANDERHFYGFADREGEILFETTKEAFTIFSKVFTLILLRIEENQTMLWGLRAKDTEKVDDETGQLLIDILEQDPKSKVE